MQWLNVSLYIFSAQIRILFLNAHIFNFMLDFFDSFEFRIRIRQRRVLWGLFGANEKPKTSSLKRKKDRKMLKTGEKPAFEFSVVWNWNRSLLGDRRRRIDDFPFLLFRFWLFFRFVLCLFCFDFQISFGFALFFDERSRKLINQTAIVFDLV